MIFLCVGIFDRYTPAQRAELEQYAAASASTAAANAGADDNVAGGLRVGVLSDAACEQRGVRPTFTEAQRLRLVRADRSVASAALVDAATLDALTAALTTDADSDAARKTMRVAVRSDSADAYDALVEQAEAAGVLQRVELSGAASAPEATDGKGGWDAIWERKGTVESDDLQLLNGYDETEFNPEKSWQEIEKSFDMKDDATVLEVGCGAGFMAQFIKNREYTGLDLSKSLVEKHIKVLGHAVAECPANKLPFSDNTFDYVICIGVPQYFPNVEYTEECVSEMKRVARCGVYVGSVRHKTRQGRIDKHQYDGPSSHLVHSVADFAKWGFSEVPAFYDAEEYFNVMNDLTKDK